VEESMKLGEVEVEGVKLAYREAGYGCPCMVLIHGALGSSLSWIHQLKMAECGGLRALALDLPGHGGSWDVEDGCETIADLAKLVEGFIEALGLEPAVLVGHSMGGAVALTIAVQSPRLVEALVLANTGAKLGVLKEILEGLEHDYERAVVELIAPMAFSPSASKELVEASIKEMLMVPQRVALRNFKACDSFDLRGRLGNVEAPTLIIASSDDKLTPVKWAEYLRDNIKGSRLVVIEGAGHASMLERPREFNEALANFLRGLSRPPGLSLNERS